MIYHYYVKEGYFYVIPFAMQLSIFGKHFTAYFYIMLVPGGYSQSSVPGNYS